MKIHEVIVESQHTVPYLPDLLPKFLKIAMRELELDALPQIHLKKIVDDNTFGRFSKNDGSIELAIANRHPVDVLRTLAHELVHYKQWQQQKLNNNSGDTGSPEENDANATAGVIMRIFNNSKEIEQ